MEHFHSPRNAGEMAAATAAGTATRNGNAPRVTIYLKVDDEAVAAASFTTVGCGATIACCSALTEMVTGQPVEECRMIAAQQVIDALDGIPSDKDFCAQIAVNALCDALSKLGD